MFIFFLDISVGVIHFFLQNNIVKIPTTMNDNNVEVHKKHKII